MKCKRCGIKFPKDKMKGKGLLYCKDCYDKRNEFIKGRKTALKLLQQMPLEVKIIKSQSLIDETIREFGIDKVYISYSGGKDSTVLSHLVRRKYPDILHIFADTSNEYPETIQHLKWEVENNYMNLITVKPKDGRGKAFNFNRVVREYGYPMFSKNVSNAIRTYRRAKTEQTKKNALDYIKRNFPKYLKYIEYNISDKCCEKLKKAPIRKKVRELGLECVFLGLLANESRSREKDWIENGCNVFYKRKDNQSRPLAFWTDKDIYEYIDRFNIKISQLYNMGYERNGCMFCGFGVQYENKPNRFQKLAITHPKSYQYLVSNFKDILDACEINYTLNK